MHTCCHLPRAEVGGCAARAATKWASCTRSNSAAPLSRSSSRTWAALTDNPCCLSAALASSSERSLRAPPRARLQQRGMPDGHGDRRAPAQPQPQPHPHPRAAAIPGAGFGAVVGPRRWPPGACHPAARAVARGTARNRDEARGCGDGRSPGHAPPPRPRWASVQRHADSLWRARAASRPSFFFGGHGTHHGPCFFLFSCPSLFSGASCAGQCRGR